MTCVALNTGFSEI